MMFFVLVLIFVVFVCVFVICVVDECFFIFGGFGFVFGQFIELVFIDVLNGCFEFEVFVGECDYFDDERIMLIMRQFGG